VYERREQVGQGRPGQVTGEQRGDRDPELGTGELEGQLAKRVPDRTRGAVTGCGFAIDLRPVDGYERELSRNETRVSRGEQYERQQW
jgi:hypothetical protein